MNNDTTPQYYTIIQFAKHHNVPDAAVEIAIQLKAIPVRHDIVAGQAIIESKNLDVHRFELLSVYEYAARKGVGFKSVYNHINEGKILPVTTIGYKIDWGLYKDHHFAKTTNPAHRQKTKYYLKDKSI